MLDTTAPLSFQTWAANWPEFATSPGVQKGRSTYPDWLDQPWSDPNARTPRVPSIEELPEGSVWVRHPQRTLVATDKALEDLQTLIRERLGLRAAWRLKKLSKYMTGWDGEDAMALSKESAALTAAFLSDFVAFPSRPSLFLTRMGHLALSWENRAGNRIEIVFEPSEVRVTGGPLQGKFLGVSPQQLKRIARALGD